MTLAEIRNESCTLCPLHENATEVCIMGNGPTDARVMIIGQAPGYNEDQQGIPFVGKAGQLLDEELERAGIPRETVFVTNTAKCYPPDDRQPTRKEMEACRPYLDAELKLVAPELVIVMGNTAMQGVLKTSGITSKANAIYEKDGRTVLPILHPAYVLRDPGHTDSFRTGLQVAKRFLDGNTTGPPETQMNLVDNDGLRFEFLRELRRVDTPIAFDIETAPTDDREGAGLQPWAPDYKVETIGFSWEPGTAWVVPLEHREAEWAPDSVLERSIGSFYKGMHEALQGKKLGGHNVKFDLQGLRVRGSGPLQAFFDTLLMIHLLNENTLSKKLKPLAVQYLGATPWAEGLKHDGHDPLDKLALYNAKDADYTLQLYHIFREKLIKQPRLARIYKHITMPAQNLLVDVELRGFPVSIRRLRDRHVALKQQMAALEEQMLSYVPADKQVHANWNRSHFLLQFMFETLGLPIVKETPKAKGEVAWKDAAVDEEVLLDLWDKHPMVPLLLEHRGLVKQEGTYTRNWKDQILVTRERRIYPNYNVTGTVTGRLSSNLQQVPRDHFIRGIITAPPGYMLIEADFSQIELRIAAMVSHDPAMMKVYQDGLDLHMEMASSITGKPAQYVTKEERSRAKPVSFGFIYGMGWRGFIPYARKTFGINVSDEEAQHYRASFFLRFPQLVNWHASQRRQVQVLGYVDSPIGRRRRLPAVRSGDKEMREMAERQAINSPVQGFASDLTLMAMVALEHDEFLSRQGTEMIGQVHDSILFESPEDTAEQSSEHIKSVMESLPIEEMFGFDPPVPIIADVTLTRWWGGK
jgi:DNA polymerase-1